MIGVLSDVFFFCWIAEFLQHIFEYFLRFVDGRPSLMQVVEFDAAIADFC